MKKQEKIYRILGIVMSLIMLSIGAFAIINYWSENVLAGKIIVCVIYAIMLYQLSYFILASIKKFIGDKNNL